MKKEKKKSLVNNLNEFHSVETPYLRVFKTHWDKAQGNTVWTTLIYKVWLDNIQYNMWIITLWLTIFPSGLCHRMILPASAFTLHFDFFLNYNVKWLWQMLGHSSSASCPIFLFIKIISKHTLHSQIWMKLCLVYFKHFSCVNLQNCIASETSCYKSLHKHENCFQCLTLKHFPLRGTRFYFAVSGENRRTKL